MNTPKPIPGALWLVRLTERIYQQAANCVERWSKLEKDGLGDQLLRALESIGLNTSEGYARSHIKERRHFFSFARGSIEEALFAVRRARDRKLMTRLEAYTLSELLIKLGRSLNNLEQTISGNEP